MRKIIIALLMLPLEMQAQTLEECQQAAERNYPLIQQYGLIEKTTELTVANIQKGWLPQISASAQATLQSDVTAFPERMQQMYEQVGITMEGLKRDQYRVGIDIQQMVYDGGSISSQKEVARLQGEVQSAQNEVNIYNVRRRVNEMFFGLLLLNEQIRLTDSRLRLLESSEEKLASMLRSGIASESDYYNVKAERLNASQGLTNLQSQRTTLARMLTAFCGIEVKDPTKPLNIDRLNIEHYSTRPELRAIDAQLRLSDAQERALDAALRPKLGVFVQGFYGYPGYNMFEDMMHRRFSLNGMIGVKLSWNIAPFYTRKNDKARLNMQREMLGVQRETFLFNNRLEEQQLDEDMQRYSQLLENDEEIISLRTSIRKAAESKLAHGIIDVNDLIKEINAENAARVQHAVHDIEMLKAYYDKKFTTNK